MKQPDNLYLFGFSGHAYVVLESVIQQNIACNGYFDFQNNTEDHPFLIPYFGNEEDFDFNLNQPITGFPSVGDNKIRKKIIGFLRNKKINEITIFDPSANISASANIGLSTYIGKNTCINALANIQDGCIINTSSVIEHECYINSNTHIAPNCTLLGNVSVGQNVFIGANSVILPGLTIGENCIVGAGSVVTKSIGANEMWYGNPAKKQLR